MKEDRRKQRTRALLREALIALIIEKGYDQVTVQDITDRANLGRATFYLHYPEGKDALLLSMMEDIHADMLRRAGDVHTGEDAFNASLTAFRHAQDNADFYRALLSKSEMAGVLANYQKLASIQFQAWLEPLLAPDKTSVPPEIISNFLMGAFNALVLWWLDNECRYPVETMARIFEQLVMTGIEGALGETKPLPELEPA